MFRSCSSQQEKNSAETKHNCNDEAKRKILRTGQEEARTKRRRENPRKSDYRKLHKLSHEQMLSYWEDRHSSKSGSYTIKLTTTTCCNLAFDAAQFWGGNSQDRAILWLYARFSQNWWRLLYKQNQLVAKYMWCFPFCFDNCFPSQERHGPSTQWIEEENINCIIT